jgi:hypothetical protein
MRSFMAGSWNLHPERVSQLNEAGPLISSVKKSLISIHPIRNPRLTKRAQRHTNTPILSTYKPVRDTAALHPLTRIYSGIGIIPRLILGTAFL